VASTILRMIFSAGPEPTLLLLGTITVSHVALVKEILLCFIRSTSSFIKALLL
jgi:hypothetical protein